MRNEVDPRSPIISKNTTMGTQHVPTSSREYESPLESHGMESPVDDSDHYDGVGERICGVLIVKNC